MGAGAAVVKRPAAERFAHVWNYSDGVGPKTIAIPRYDRELRTWIVVLASAKDAKRTPKGRAEIARLQEHGRWR